MIGGGIATIQPACKTYRARESNTKIRSHHRACPVYPVLREPSRVFVTALVSSSQLRDSLNHSRTVGERRGTSTSFRRNTREQLGALSCVPRPRKELISEPQRVPCHKDRPIGPGLESHLRRGLMQPSALPLCNPLQSIDLNYGAPSSHSGRRHFIPTTSQLPHSSGTEVF